METDVQEIKTTKYVNYPNGKPNCITPYVNGLLHGLAKWWHENGRIECIISYVNGNRHGLARWWHENGELFSKSFYLNGKLHGKDECWFENGNRMKTCSFVHGQSHGIFKGWIRLGFLEHFLFCKKENQLIEFNFYHPSKCKDIPENKVLFDKSQWKQICKR